MKIENEIITYKIFDNYINRIVKQCLKKYKTSPENVTIRNHIPKNIINCINPDYKTIDIKKGWRKIISDYANDFAIKFNKGISNE